MENTTKLDISCATKFKMLASYLAYVAVIASLFGISHSGYNFARAAVAAVALAIVTAPAWLMILRKECKSVEREGAVGQAGKRAALG